MGTIDEQTLEAGWVRWRHEFHRIPETGFAERRTAERVAQVLELLGLQVHRGIGGTGVVASLTVGSGSGVIGLRADMDALAMTETAEHRAHASTHPGRMHACGHDGHMSMLLGAAQLLTRRRDFDGTVRFIFQPAEEHGRGAAAMLADGLLERFPMDEIYGAHNIPGLPAGHFATSCHGPRAVPFAEALLRLATAESVGRIIDIGAGRGELLSAIAGLAGGAEGPGAGIDLVGVDVVARPAGLATRIDWIESPGGAELPDLGRPEAALVVANEWLDVIPCPILEADGAGELREVEGRAEEVEGDREQALP